MWLRQISTLYYIHCVLAGPTTWQFALCTSRTCSQIVLAWLAQITFLLFDLTFSVQQSYQIMFGWLLSFLGLESINPPSLPDPPKVKIPFESSLEKKDWPEGPQLHKQICFFEPDGWAHSHWAWRSNGYIDHPGSLHPKLDKAECRNCLGVLECGACGKVLWPCTKTADMNTQLVHKCPQCSGELVQITCKARTHHFVIEEDGSQYSIWKHIGSHSSHPQQYLLLVTTMMTLTLWVDHFNLFES